MTTEVTTEHYFGGCPECGDNDGYVNIGADHWFLCDTHKTCWPIGSNLFSIDDTEEPQQAAAAKVARYRTVEPVRAKAYEREALSFERYAIEARYFDCTSQLRKFARMLHAKQEEIVQRVLEIDAELGRDNHRIGIVDDLSTFPIRGPRRCTSAA
jgi:hypothetical protein